MFRALWFFAQLAIVVSVAVWILSQKGKVDLVWNNYSLSLDLGLFLLFAAIFVFTALLVFKMIGGVVNIPATLARKRKDKNRTKGMQALTRGFVAIAAGDGKKAGSFAKEARQLLSSEVALPLLLEAHAARMNGDEGLAQKSFEALLSDKDAAFFGIRGLVQSSLQSGDVSKALTYAKTALEQNPKQPWILKSVYDLELQSRHWEDAYSTLSKLSRGKVLDSDAAKKDEVALLMLLAGEDKTAGNMSGWLNKVERILKLNPAFVPAVCDMAEYFASKGLMRKIAPMVERAWKTNPHPDLAAWWDKISPMPKSSDPFRRLRWFEKLVALNPQSADSHYACAKIAMELGLAGEAKSYLTAAEKIKPSADIYKLFANIEEKGANNPTIIRSWFEKAADAPPSNVWYCTQTGTIYARWSGIAEPHGAFNTIEWGNPLSRSYARRDDYLGQWDDPILIEKKN